MVRKNHWGVSLIVIVCLGLLVAGCPKKTAMKEEPSLTSREDTLRAEEREKARQREAEERRKAGQAAEGDKKDFEKSIVAAKTPGIDGQVFESSLLKDIHFDFDMYDIRPQDAETMKQNAAPLKKYPNVKIQVEGHCDERGTAEYNLALGERRANSAKRYLVSLGVSPDRLSTITYGKERPIDPGHNEEAWAKNRRAHFIILSK